MSNLLVQNIKHTNNTTSMAIDTSGQVTIRGEGSATTTNLQQGLAKCWINFDGSGTIATRDSFNVSGITDDATGRYTVSINNDMANDDYAVLNYTSGSTNSSATAFNNNFLGGNNLQTSTFAISAYAADFEDSDMVMAQVTGDLA
jgi:hypothetical protein